LRPTTRLVAVNFPNNPTGAICSQENWRALVELCDEHGATLLSDEVYRGAVSVMMRVVFLLFAEERRLLPSDNELYAQSYSAGRLGAGMLTHQLGQSHDALAANIALYRSELAAAHGPDARGHVAVMLHTMIGDDRDQVRDIVREPFSNYLRSSIDLIARDTVGAAPGDFDLSRLPERDKEFMVRLSFDRYFNDAGLFGTVDDGVEVVRRLRSIGVDEIACLIDFGVEQDLVLRNLRHLGELRLRTAQA